MLTSMSGTPVIWRKQQKGGGEKRTIEPVVLCER